MPTVLLLRRNKFYIYTTQAFISEMTESFISEMTES